MCASDWMRWLFYPILAIAAVVGVALLIVGNSWFIQASMSIVVLWLVIYSAVSLAIRRSKPHQFS